MLTYALTCNFSTNGICVVRQATLNVVHFPYLQHVNALGRPRGDVGMELPDW